MENTFLPNNYQKPATESKYYKFVVGENHFRILSDAIVGWVDWQETEEGKKPVRTKEKPEKSINANRPAKHFWVFVIWDYQDKKVKILEITQATIQESILLLHKNPSWGDPKGYDLNVNRVGKEKDTKYNTVPIPPKQLDPEITKIYLATKIDLDKLYTNENPFLDEETPTTNSTAPLPDEEVSIEEPKEEINPPY